VGRAPRCLYPPHHEPCGTLLDVLAGLLVITPLIVLCFFYGTLLAWLTLLCIPLAWGVILLRMDFEGCERTRRTN
jgi:hypothetical protein